MAITTYSELQTAVGNWLNRSDLTSRIPEFITLFESRVKRDLRVRQMEKRATADTTSGTSYLALPSDYLEARSFHLNTDPKQQMLFMPPGDIRSKWLGSESGQPTMFAIVGDEIRLAPTPDGTYETELDYYAFSVLSDSNTSNWLLEDYPDIYLAGALVEAFSYARSEQKAAEWQRRLDYHMAGLERSDRDSKYVGPLVQRAV
jgi:hypothetical protein